MHALLSAVVRLRRPLAVIAPLGGLLLGCGDDSGVGGQGGEAGGAPSISGELKPIHEADPELIDAGYQAFSNAELVQGVLPKEAMRNLYITWTTSLAAYYTYYTDADAYWAAFNERYGTVPSPFKGADYPAGFALASNGKVGIDCLLCHASRFEGKTLIGASNNRLDLRAFVEDVQALPAAVAALKKQDLPPPYGTLVQGLPDDEVPEPYASLEIPTGAAGLNDGFGLGLVTSTYYAEPPPDLKTFMGYEDAPAWWTMKYKERLYTDGSAPGDGIYTMMSTLLAFGLSISELAAYLPTFKAIQSYVWSMPAPRWEDFELPAVDPQLVQRGEAVFAEKCASCHGTYNDEVFPNALSTPAEIGTDALRAESFGVVEADWFNSFIPGPDYEMESTKQYLAPALTGVFASPPYLHNGSVPTLRALLVPAERPSRWRRASEAMDPVAVGLTFELVSEAPDLETVAGRKVVDTSLPGLSNEGHEIELDEEEVTAVLELLKTF
jgi:mono/diheme cytochrome c family protein